MHLLHATVILTDSAVSLESSSVWNFGRHSRTRFHHHPAHLAVASDCHRAGTDTHTHTGTDTHTHKHTQALTHIHTGTDTHTHKHTHTGTYTHTHKHTPF